MAKKFRHYLNFIDPAWGRFEITEPVGFDASTFTIEQEKGRFARDVTFGNEEIDEVFWDGIYEWSGVPYVFNTGVVAYHLTMGFEKIVEAYLMRGAEARIERIIALNGVDFTTGILDTATAKYNGRNEIQCKTIQDVPRAVFKRRADVEVDMFDTVDLDGNPSTPCSTVRTLLKAKPIYQSSIFDSSGVDSIVVSGSTFRPGYFNGIKNIVSNGIDDTLSWFDNAAIDMGGSGDPDYDGIPWGFQAIRAKETLTNIKASMDLNISIGLPIGGDATAVRGYFLKGPEVFDIDAWGLLNSTFPRYQFFDTGLLGVDSGIFLYNFNGHVDVDLPNMSAGEILYFFFVQSGEQTTIAAGFGENRVEITATSTAIDSIIEGVFVHDAMAKCVDMTTDGLALNAPLFAVGGIHHDQIVASGLLARQDKTRPFLLKSGEFFKSVTQEVCCDYKVKTGEIEVKRRSGATDSFYPNIEVGVFNSAPNDNFNNYLNPRYQLQTFEFGYKIYEQERTAEDTLDAVHTDSTWQLPTKAVDEKLDILITHWRDAYKWEEMRKKAVTAKDNTSLADDNSYGILDIVPLAPGTLSGFSRTLTMLASGFQLKILSDGTFNWSLLGFNIGDTFKILSGQNTGTYTVTTISPEGTIITLTSGSIVAFTGSNLIEVEYTLNNVLWVNRTNQNFQTISGVNVPDNYSNLQYSIKRNMQYWFPFLATATNFLTGLIKCTSFKNSQKTGGVYVPNLITEFNNGGLIVDNAEIDTAYLKGLQDVTPYLDEITLIADFNSIDSLCRNMEATDGFIRYIDAKGMVKRGFPTVLSANWSSSLLEATLEPKYEPNENTINSVSGGLEINEIVYTSFPIDWFKIVNGYVRIYDANDIAITNPTLFSTIAINGTKYTDRILFMDAMLNLIP